MTISKKFKQAIKLSDIPAYKHANQVGLHPTTLSKIIIGCQSPGPYKDQLVTIGKGLSLKADEIFESKNEVQR